MLPVLAITGGVVNVTKSFYPPVGGNSSVNYTDEVGRVKAWLADVAFLCNVRDLSDAYPGKNWVLQYSVTPGLHGLDVIPTFYKSGLNLEDLFRSLSLPVVPRLASLSRTYQSYLVAHARTGNPNRPRRSANSPAVFWPQPEKTGDILSKVLDFTDSGFVYIEDRQLRKSACRFRQDVLAGLTNFGGTCAWYLRSYFIR